MHLKGVGFIPVVRDDFKYGSEELCIIYLYNEISAEKIPNLYWIKII